LRAALTQTRHIFLPDNVSRIDQPQSAGRRSLPGIAAIAKLPAGYAATAPGKSHPSRRAGRRASRVARDQGFVLVLQFFSPAPVGPVAQTTASFLQNEP